MSTAAEFAAHLRQEAEHLDKQALRGFFNAKAGASTNAAFEAGKLKGRADAFETLANWLDREARRG